MNGWERNEAKDPAGGEEDCVTDRIGDSVIRTTVQ